MLVCHLKISKRVYLGPICATAPQVKISIWELEGDCGKRVNSFPHCDYNKARYRILLRNMLFLIIIIPYFYY